MSDPRDIQTPAAQSPEEALASQVSEKVSQHLLDEAYTLLKNGVQANFADKNADEKNASWAVISEKLSQDGSLSKLSAPFMKDVADDVDRNQDGRVQKSELSPMAQNARNPFYKGMAQQMLDGFDVAASLHHDDQAIDRVELNSFAKRQFMPERSEFVGSLINNVESKLNENPVEAVTALHNSLSARANLETPSERMETWQAVADQLKERGLIPKMSMAFLTHHQELLDANKNSSISLNEVRKFEGSRSPVVQEFAKYIAAEFNKIASVDYNADEISRNEQAIWQRKMFTQQR